jgi:hypothetical protein
MDRLLSCARARAYARDDAPYQPGFSRPPHRKAGDLRLLRLSLHRRHAHRCATMRARGSPHRNARVLIFAPSLPPCPLHAHGDEGETRATSCRRRVPVSGRAKEVTEPCADGGGPRPQGTLSRARAREGTKNVRVRSLARWSSLVSVYRSNRPAGDRRRNGAGHLSEYLSESGLRAVRRVQRWSIDLGRNCAGAWR